MHFHWSESDQRSPKDGCESLAPFVMALFDGEANEEQAKRARAHLLVCQTCAQRWLDWNRSRDLLRSVAVPAPPPTLLWRVLMACRLAGFTRKTTTPDVVTAPKQESLGASGAPDALRAQILARTTRAAAAAETVSTVTKSRRQRSPYAMPMFAVPALAMWLMVLQRDAIFHVPSPEPEAYDAAPMAAPQRAASTPRRPQLLKKLPVIHALQKHPVAHQVEAPDSDEVDEREPEVREAHYEREAHRDAAPARIARVEPERSTQWHQDEPAPRAERSPLIQLVSSEVAPSSRRTSPVELSVERPSAEPRKRVVVRPASLSDKDGLVRLRTAHWQLATPKLARLVDSNSNQAQALKVSLPPTRSVISSARPTSPASATRPTSETTDGTDENVDEVRSVVDDFRAALTPEVGVEPDFEDIAS